VSHTSPALQRRLARLASTLPSIAIPPYNALYATQPTLIQAASPMTMAVPVVVFFFALRAFMLDGVATGAGK
jgi:multiple sugar transport system permease protein